MDYKNLTSEDVLELVASGARLSELLQNLWDAGNQEAYFMLDAYVEEYGYN